MALRAEPVALAAALNVTVPLPVPAAPLVTDSHGAVDTAVHPQAAVVVTANDPVPPATGVVCVAGEIE